MELSRFTAMYEVRDKNPLAFNTPMLGVVKAYWYPKDADAIFSIFSVDKRTFMQCIKSSPAVDKITKIKEAYLRAKPDHYKRLKEMKDAVVKDPISEMFDQLTTFEQIFGGEISNADNKTMKDAVKIMQFQASMEGKTIRYRL